MRRGRPRGLRHLPRPGVGGPVADDAAEADRAAAARPRRPAGGDRRRGEHGGVPPGRPVRLQHRRAGHRRRADRGRRGGAGQRHDHRRRRDGLLGPRRARRARRRRRGRHGQGPVTDGGPAGSRRPAAPVRPPAPAHGPAGRRPRAADLHRAGRRGRRVRGADPGDRPRARGRPRRRVRPVAHIARAGRDRRWRDRREWLRDAAAPGRRPGRAHDRQARPARGDARRRRSRTSPQDRRSLPARHSVSRALR